MKHRNPHAHDNDADADAEPGQLPVDPDDGHVPTGLPDEPQEDGIVDPQV